MSARRRATGPSQRPSSRAAFDQVAAELGDLARDPRCPRLPDEAWDALLRGQVASDENELDRHAQTLRAYLRRLSAAIVLR
ncbi:hypothetical protein [Deinococcus koreensis]|uniref:Uncharacterized protein n=1 Tax=Deinococcus koreensis TaxID=2054903 RepID=A0A2K3UT22_9DEIO|nr:hypothetical protein [Deinococcus koreensis]PNY79679.1 hypothetical protein CVO96_17090 [Deinococcus koreensis]